MEQPIAKARRQSKQIPFDSDAFTARIRELLEKHNESFREAGMDAGLDHQAIRRILAGQRPNMVNCILLADHFGVNPNEFLEMAGWPMLRAFDVRTVDSDKLPPEAADVAMAVAKIPNPGERKQVTQAILTLLSKYYG